MPEEYETHHMFFLRSPTPRSEVSLLSIISDTTIFVERQKMERQDGYQPMRVEAPATRESHTTKIRRRFIGHLVLSQASFSLLLPRVSTTSNWQKSKCMAVPGTWENEVRFSVVRQNLPCL